MDFIRVADMSAAAEALGARINSELDAHKVLWLVPGGSNIAAAVQVMESISDEQSNNLAIMLTDERYGDVGHKDSNFQQLYDAGFAPKNGTVVPVLVSGLSSEETTQRFGDAYAKASEFADIIIGQFGIGTDGHIAGILPDSAACDAKELTCGYEASKFLRVTLTFPALKRVSAAYALVFGSDKKEALQKLESGDLPLTEQPSQILKQLPETYVYNDQIGGK